MPPSDFSGLFGSLFGTPRCVLCDAATGGVSICTGCLYDLPFVGCACRTCGQPIARSATRCGRCLVSPPPQDATVVACHYAFPADELVAGLKFDRDRRFAGVMAEALQRPLVREVHLPDCFVPVPLHRFREWRRGFNQAAEIAAALARRFDRPVVNALSRVRPTRAQTTLPRSKRFPNVDGAFRATRPDPLAVHVGLVDDVMTTGATMAAAVAALNRRQPSRITAIAFARAD